MILNKMKIMKRKILRKMHKKIKKLLCDKHIPAALRDRLPLVCLHDGQILWCPAVAFADGFPPPAKGGCIRISLLKKTEQL